MWPNSTETADLVTFTEEILNGKFYFLCSDVKTVLKLLLTIRVVIDSTASVQETRNWEAKWNMAENLRLKETKKDFEMINKKVWGKRKAKPFKRRNWPEHHVKVILRLLLKNISHQKITLHSDTVIDGDINHQQLLNKLSNKLKLLKK